MSAIPKMRSGSLKLPTSLDARSNKILMFDCLLLLGDELGDYYDGAMRKCQGEDWLRNLAQLRNDHKLNLHDPDFVIKEPLRSDSPLRAILPKFPSFYKNLDILRRVRNLIAHNNAEGGFEQTREILGILLAVSMDINLSNCSNQYAGAIRRFEALEQGEIFAEESTTGSRIEDFENRSAEIEEQLFEERERVTNVEELLEEARSVVVIKEMELEALSESDQAKAVAVEKMKVELDQAREEAEELRSQLERNYQRTEDLKKNEVNLKNLVASLALPAVGTSSLEEMEEGEWGSNLGSPVEAKIAMILSNQEVGSLWGRPKGLRKVVLSVFARDLVEAKGGTVLAKADPVETRALAERWLKIRPQGGRIFIDTEGHASTLIDNRLVYLGNISSILK